jgi:hypothetical protein
MSTNAKQARLNRGKAKAYLRPFAEQVWKANSLSLPLPDELIDKMPTAYDEYVVDILENDFHLRRDGNGWTNARGL